VNTWNSTMANGQLTFFKSLLVGLSGLVILVSLGACSKNSSLNEDNKDSTEISDEGNGETAEGEFQIIALEPATGKSGDPIVIRGDVDSQTDLVAFGDQIVVPVADHNNGRQFLENAKENFAENYQQLIIFVPDHACLGVKEVCVLRKDAKSNCLPFDVIAGEPCSNPSESAESQDKPEEGPTVGERVIGDNTTDPIQVTITSSKTHVYHLLDPETTIAWKVDSGNVDVVTILANEEELVNGDQLTGTLTVQPETTTEYKIIPYYRGVEQPVDHNAVSVVVIGVEDIEDLGPLVNMDVSPKNCARNRENNFTCPEVTVRYVTNKLEGGVVEFVMTEDCEVTAENPCEELFRKTMTNASGDFTLIPEKTGILTATMVRAGQENVTSESGPVRMNVTIPGVQKMAYTMTSWKQWSNDRTSAPDPALRGWAKVRFHIQNAEHAWLMGDRGVTLCRKAAPLDSVCENVRMHNVGMNSFFILDVSESGEAQGTYYMKQDCSGACQLRLVGHGFGRTEHDEWTQSVPNLNAQVEKFTVDLSNGDWRYFDIAAKVTNVKTYALTGCRQTFSGVENVENNITDWEICSQVSEDNKIALLYKDYFSDAWKTYRTKYPRVGTPSIKILNKRKKITDNKGKYQIEVTAQWARQMSFYVKKKNGDICHKQEDVLEPGNWGISGIRRARSESRPAFNMVVKNFNDYNVDEDCYIFEVVISDYSNRLHTGRIEATPKVKITFTNERWWATSQMIDNASVIGWATQPDACTATAFRRRTRIEVKNEASEYTNRVWAQGGEFPDGQKYICPQGVRNLMWESWGDWEVSAKDSEVHTAKVNHYYYYVPGRIYGCKYCTRNLDQNIFCTDVDWHWQNREPAHYGGDLSWCRSRPTTPSPHRCNSLIGCQDDPYR
jgi:hypothetical protein